MSEPKKKWDFPVRKNWSGEKPEATPIPRRWFGPVSPDEAERITDLVLESKEYRQDCIDWAKGDFDQREMDYRFQSAFEAEASRSVESEPLEGTEFDEHETGGIGA